MICRLILFIVLTSISLKSNGQKASKPEILWALGHPFAALKMKKIKKKAEIIYNQPDIKTLLDNYSSGGKLDAFRHVFFMAAFAQHIKIKKLRKLGIAHEKGNYRQFLKHKTENGEVPDSLSNVMDLANNELGFEIGVAYKDLNLEKLKELVIWKIKTGHASILKRNKQGSFVDCNDNIIDLKLYAGKWFVPKCLTISD